MSSTGQNKELSRDEEELEANHVSENNQSEKPSDDDDDSMDTKDDEEYQARQFDDDDFHTKGQSFQYTTRQGRNYIWLDPTRQPINGRCVL